MAGRAEIFKHIVASEEKFVTEMKEFIDRFISPLFLRDTPFKRSMLEDASIATSFNSYVDIHAACSAFLLSVKSSTSGAMMATAYSQFASSLVLFSQYISEQTSTVNSLAKFNKPLQDYSQASLPFGSTIEAYLALPGEHYTVYRTNLAQFVKCTEEDSPEFTPLRATLDIVSESCALVDAKIEEENDKVQLLLLQNQCKL